MPQKIDIHGIFVDPETITDLQLQKRISVFYPVFYEVEAGRSIFSRFSSPQKRILRFDHQEPFGIILADAEQPDPASYIVEYKEAVIERLLRGLGQAGKSITGHLTEMLKIEVSGDRPYRILQSGRNVKRITIREIPAKVRLLSGQWVDVFKSSPEYDFQGGTPYAVTGVSSAALMIRTKDQINVLFGAGVDATDEEVNSSYQKLINVYNQIQARRDEEKIPEKKDRPLIQMPQINIQLPKVELPKIAASHSIIGRSILSGKKKKSDEMGTEELNPERTFDTDDPKLK